MIEEDDLKDLFDDLEDDEVDCSSPFDEFDLDTDEEYTAQVLIEHLNRLSVPPSEYLPKHLQGHSLCAKTFCYVIKGMKYRINNYEITPASAENIRVLLVDDYTDKLKVSVDKNFTGEPYFMFKWEGLDMFGDRW